MAEKENQTLSETEPPSAASPVRMKWGRVVRDENEESAEEKEKQAALETARAERRATRLLHEIPHLSERSLEARQEDPPPPESAEPQKQGSIPRQESTHKKSFASPQKPYERPHKPQKAPRPKKMPKPKRKQRERPPVLLPLLKGLSLFLLSLLLSIRLPKIKFTKKTVTALLVTAALTLLVSIALGNLLLQKAASAGTENTSGSSDSTEAETVPFDRGKEVPTLNGGILSLKNATEQSLTSAAETLLARGTDEVTLLLRSSDRSLFYSSKTALELGLESPDSGLLPIADTVKLLHRKGLYLSVAFPLFYPTEPSDLASSVTYAYEQSLLIELALAGVDEIFLIETDRLFFGSTEESDSAKSIKSLMDLAAAVHEKAPDTLVGTALTPEFLATKESDRYLSTLATVFDFLLLDLRAKEGIDAYAQIYETVGSHYYFILRYAMRILIPGGEAEAVIDREIHNWQEGTIRALTPAET